MANALGTLFGDIAAAIREKNGETGTMKPAEFPDKIAAIETGGTSGEEKTLTFATGEFQITAAGGQRITHNMGVTPDIVVYFLAKLDSNAMLTDSSNYYSGEVAYSSEAIADGAERKLYLLNGSNFTITRGIWGTADEWDTLGCVRNANPESFDVGCVDTNNHCPNAVYRWAAIGNLKEHNDVVTARFYDGETLLKTETVPFGAVVTPPELTKDGYELSWNPADMTMKFDTDFSAVWTEIKLWNTVALATYLTEETETSKTYKVTDYYHNHPYIQFIDGAAWTYSANRALTETDYVFDIGEIVEGKSSAYLEAYMKYTSCGSGSSTSDSFDVYVNWFDKDGEFITYTYFWKTEKFVTTGGTRNPSKTVSIPEGAHYIGVHAKFGGYASSKTFNGVTATFTMTVS